MVLGEDYRGASLPKIMVKGGWTKTDTVVRYVDRMRLTLQNNTTTSQLK
jgi:hypothetical protein